ncbi:hypothetical protein GUA87_02405 [Sneathiella sp. P13V-1]|uniref:hypothetical protein n=1 Tax=Sneathiella sp. P13V-1 TaxID=2697366 RepID=UPI00187B47B6|nr:hypothetical protein [Sneathiella sp. P13V-1]MBE7635681.1 hypothetical protein [Sneathiella sp. P13V-1]
MKRFFAVLVVFASVTIIPQQSKKAVAQEIPSAAAASMVLDELFKKLDLLIETARSDGEYLLASAGLEAKEALKTWKEVNNELLDTAFSELDKASQDNFSRAQKLVIDANNSIGSNIELAQQITDSANQILASIPTQMRAHVLRYYPRIMPPQTGKELIIRIRGVNLDEADPILNLANGKAQRTLTGPLEAQFKIPASELPVDQTQIKMHSLKLTLSPPSSSWWKRIFGGKDNIEREITVFSLPKILASFTLNGDRKYKTRIEREFTRNLGQFKASNRRIYKIAKPDKGWKWDLNQAFTKIQGQGESGRCEGVDMNQSTEDGVSFFAHLDRINKWNHQGPGYVNCSLKGKIYRVVSETDTFATQSGQLSWTQDKVLKLPSDFNKFQLNITKFDGVKRSFTNTGSDQFFGVQLQGDRILITPKIPKDIVN